ncbi:MAG: hypothetical protein C0469_17390 [Cyanobacteria bacterium DS2.3.42]|nr:hypothetical protein [Cyanobacteria bacterium DS2.3.42]
MFRADAPQQNDFVQEPSTGAALTRDLTAEDFKAVFKSEPGETLQTSLDFSTKIRGYDDHEVWPTSQSLDVAPVDLPADEQTLEPDVQPEQKLMEAIMSLPENPTTEQMADAMHEAAVALDDQLDTVEDAQAAYLNYDGLGTLLPQSQKEYETAFYAVNPALQQDKKFVDNLATLPNLIYSGQTEQAAVLMSGMLQIAGAQGKEQLQAYFDKLKSVAAENPDLVKEYSGKFQTYTEELRTFDEMYKLYKKSPLGQ